MSGGINSYPQKSLALFFSICYYLIVKIKTLHITKNNIMKIKIIKIKNDKSIFHKDYGIVPEWVGEISEGFYNFLGNRFADIYKVINK